MKKITIDKNEGIAEVIDRILAAEDSDITLVIPSYSALAKSASNFRLLKREAGLAEKEIIIESVDDEALALAEANGIATGANAAGAKGPRSYGNRTNGVSDIVPASHADREVAVRRKKGASAPVRLEVHAESDDGENNRRAQDDEDGQGNDGHSFFGAGRFFKASAVPPPDSVDDDDEEGSRGNGISGRAVAWTVGIVVILAVAFYGVTAIFGRAQIAIDFTQTPWNYQNNFVADKSVAAVAAAAGGGATAIPAQVFTTQKNITQLFPATGASANVAVKARGTLTIYNDYGAAAQELVATTRFVAPDGKIFRLVNGVTVPGAKVASGGKITPSSIGAPIIADQGGPAYNVGPIPKLTIPGFQKNPAKYNGFYGAVSGQMTGGSVGAKPQATAADVANAKTKTTAILQSDLEGSLAASYPNNFKILDGATDVQITKLTVSTSTDANGNFSVFAEATLTAIGFDEAAFRGYLLTLAQGNGGTTMTFKSFAPHYSNVQASFGKGQVSFAFSGQGALEPAFSPGDFAAQIAGKSVSDTRGAIQALPQLSDGKISVWPVWLWNMPSNARKIQVTAN